MTVKEAAEKLDMSPLNIRGWILNGDCPFGYVIRKRKSRYGRNTYVIIEQLLNKFLEGEIGDVSTLH